MKIKTMRHSPGKIKTLALLTAAALGTGSAFASVLEEVTVTAQKREQNMQDVGVSVTAYSGDQMKALGITNTVEITEQTADAITFKVPDGTEMKRYRLMILTGGAGAAYMEQPIALEIVDEATAKQRAEEGDVELEIIEAEPAEEAEPEDNRRRRRNN